MKRGASKSPRRGKKHDMIVNPGASREQIMVDMAVVAFDRTALEMDRKWGIDRLVDLVTPDMAIKYGQALARMNEAISDGSDPTLAQRRANDCVRGGVCGQWTELPLRAALSERQRHTGR